MVRVGDDWQVQAWEALDRWTQISDRPLHLSQAPADTDLLTGTTEASVVAAGEVADRPGGGAGPPQVWELYSTAYDPEGPPGPWQRMPLDPAPDALTDLADWALGYLVVGHDDLHPVIYDFDRTDGDRTALPQVDLDPEHPMVCIARGFRGERVLAVQTEAGPSVLFEVGGDWEEVTAPDGELGAVAVVGDLVYLLVDGSIWYDEVPAGHGPTPRATPASSD